MTARDSHVAGQPPDWRATNPGHKTPGRRLPKNFRKALSKWLSRVGIACGLVIACAILWARSQGWMP